MTILTVLKDAAALDALSAMLEKQRPDDDLLSHTDSLKALSEARSKEIDVALLDTELPELNGLDLGRYLQELYPLVNLIFIGNGPERAYDALALHASGYLIAPATGDALARELTDLRHPAEQKAHKRVFAHTFGNFDLFVDDKPIAFKYSRTKELAALLVNNRGAQTTNGEIIATLWEDDGDPEKRRSYLSNLRQDLQNTLSKYKLAGLLHKQRGSLAIAADRIECDLYDWLAKKSQSRYRYLGEYMNQYSWAEDMHAELDEISYEMEEEY